jgi:hypothetical protein
MKIWIKKHMGEIAVVTLMIVIFLLVVYEVSHCLCYNCPPVNASRIRDYIFQPEIYWKLR